MQEMVWVHWRDSASHSPQLVRAEAQQLKPLVLETVGVLVGLSERCMIVAQDWIEENDAYREILTIPRECIETYVALVRADDAQP